MLLNRITKICFCIFLCFAPSLLLSNNQPFDLEKALSALPKYEKKKRKKHKQVTRASGAAIATAASFFNSAGIPEILDNKLYKKTHPVHFRNIVQQPISSNCIAQHSLNKEWSVSLFFNRDGSKNYTETTDSNRPKLITSYINLSGDTLLEAMENARTNNTVKAILSNFPDFSVPDIFNLFAPMTLQEHKIGLIWHYHKTWNDIEFNVRLPFLWSERNFYFTEEEKSKIYDNELLQMLGEVDEWAFAREYLISDQLGFGTLEVTISTDIIKNDSGGLNAGLTLYFPTEIPLKKGLLGTYRELIDESPELKFSNLINNIGNALNTGWEEEINSYFAHAFTRFTTNLLYTPLGFDHHPGIGFLTSPTWHLNDHLTWKSNYEILMLIPMYKNRLITDKILSKTEVTDDFNSVGSSIAKVSVIEKSITRRLFPPLARCLVFPGLIINSTSSFHYERANKATYTFGYNTWIQLREQILSHNLNPATFWDIDNAEKPYASQLKIYAKVDKEIKTKSCNLTFAAYLDYTIATEAIGNDFLINFEIRGTF